MNKRINIKANPCQLKFVAMIRVPARRQLQCWYGEAVKDHFRLICCPYCNI